VTEKFGWPNFAIKNWWPNVLGNTQKNLNNDQNFSIVGSMVETKQLSISQLKFLGKNQKTFSKDWKISSTQFGKTNDNQSFFDHLN
jgi:hypothetical protein